MKLQPTPLAVVILNACPHPALRETRDRILSEAGYYPASAGSAEDASLLATSVVCSVAIICHSFMPDERRQIQRRIEDLLPATKIMQLSCQGNNEPLALLSSVKDALAGPRNGRSA
jgi:hypothetical protein